ncbi:hypothetical protein [Priestia megaterium]|uniref:hypothetical protein n=1 Tax=Priestia megaterium TaxID=1404 RepID=UPI00046F527F|nr:hypothetical protein [Priestia megaterium]PFB05257.1 hypothetical protein CN383_02865 [Priestia megaterium]
MIQLNNGTQQNSNDLKRFGIGHQFAFSQITVHINLSPDNRVNEILVDMIKKLAGVEEQSMETTYLINNNVFKEVVFIQPIDLVLKFLEQIFLSSNRSRSCDKFCKKHKLNRYGIFPGIKLRESEEIIMSNNLEDIVNHEGLIFSFAKEKIYNFKSKNIRPAQHNLEAIKATPLISWYFENINKLKDKELLWFMTNIVGYQAAKTEVRQLMRRDSRIAYYYKLALDLYFEPLSYKRTIADDKFPFDYLYQAVNSRLVTTMRIGASPKTATQEEISKLLKLAQERFINEAGPKVMFLRVDAGSGKTTTIANLFRSNMAYVGPTHKLIKQFIVDVQKRNPYIDIVYIPAITDEDIPKCKYKEKMIYHEKRGEWEKAIKYRRKAILEFGSSKQKKLLAEYDAALNKKTGSPFITHSRFVNKGKGFFNNEKFKEIDTIIIDEDILPSIFPSSLHSDEAVINDIKSLLKLINEDLKGNVFSVAPSKKPYDNKLIKLRDALLAFIEQIKKAKIEGVVKNKTKNIVELSKSTLNSYIKKCENLTLDIFHILGSQVLTCKNHSQWPATIYTQDYSNVFKNKKILIMSATLDENVHLDLFKNKICRNTEWVDMPRTQIKGKIISHADLSTTKNSFDKNPERISLINKKIQEIGCIEHIITYKDKKNEIKNGGNNHMHFYNTAGYNDYSGQNLAIVGTPNNIPENAVTLYYLIYGEVPKSLKYDKEKEEIIYDLRNRSIIKDEFKFSFFTFEHAEDDKVRAIHIWSTYSELIQAVGRARLTHYECEVHVFSRLPIPQCVFNYEIA